MNSNRRRAAVPVLPSMSSASKTPPLPFGILLSAEETTQPRYAAYSNSPKYAPVSPVYATPQEYPSAPREFGPVSPVYHSPPPPPQPTEQQKQEQALAVQQVAARKARRTQVHQVHQVFAEIMAALNIHTEQAALVINNPELDPDEAALLSYATYAFPILSIPVCEEYSRFWYKRYKTVIAPDLFLLSNNNHSAADIHTVLPKLPVLEVDMSQTRQIGKGVFGSVFRLDHMQRGTILADVCFKVQYQDKTRPLDRMLMTPLTPAMLKKPTSRMPNAKPVRGGYRVGYFSQECLALYALNRLFAEWDDQKKPQLNNQKWSEWVPRLYGSFMTETTEDKFACISIMQYMDGYDTLDHFASGKDIQDTYRVLELFFKELEGAPLFMHNYDCHHANILIHRQTKQLCLIDLAMTSFIMPLSYFCSLKEVTGMQADFQERCVNGGIPLVSFYVGGSNYRPDKKYNMFRLCSNNPVYNQCQENTYHLPFLKLPTANDLMRIEQSIDLSCSMADVRLISSALYLDTNHRYERLMKRYQFFEHTSLHQLECLIERNLPYCADYDEICSWKNKLFAFDDFLCMDNGLALAIISEALNANYQFDSFLNKLAQSNLVLFVLNNADLGNKILNERFVDWNNNSTSHGWDLRHACAQIESTALESREKRPLESAAVQQWLGRIQAVMDTDFCDNPSGRLVIALATQILAYGGRNDYRQQTLGPIAHEDVQELRDRADTLSIENPLWDAILSIFDFEELEEEGDSLDRVFHQETLLATLQTYAEQARQALKRKLNVYLQRKNENNNSSE